MPFGSHTDVPALLPPGSPNASHLGPVQSLELAVLGAAAHGLVSLDRLVDTVWCLCGGDWRPASGIVYGTLQRLVAEKALIDRETWISSNPFLYAVTPAGARRLRNLVRKPIHLCCNPPARAAAAIKLGLLDLLDRKEAVAMVEELHACFVAYQHDLEVLRRRAPNTLRSLEFAMDQRLRINRQRIDDLDTCLRRLTGERTVDA